MAAGLDAVLKAAQGERVGRLGWQGPTLSEAPSLLPGNPSGQKPRPSPTQPAGGLGPSVVPWGLLPADHAVSGVGPVEILDHKILAPHHGARVG